VAITAAETVDPTSRCRYLEEPVFVGTVGRITSVAGVPRVALADARNVHSFARGQKNQ